MQFLALQAGHHYHLQSTEQVERFVKTLTVRLQDYIDAHQPEWDTFVQYLLYGYSAKMHCFMQRFHVSFIHCQNLSGALIQEAKTS